MAIKIPRSNRMVQDTGGTTNVQVIQPRLFEVDKGPAIQQLGRAVGEAAAMIQEFKERDQALKLKTNANEWKKRIQPVVAGLKVTNDPGKFNPETNTFEGGVLNIYEQENRKIYDDITKDMSLSEKETFDLMIDTTRSAHINSLSEYQRKLYEKNEKLASENILQNGINMIDDDPTEETIAAALNDVILDITDKQARRYITSEEAEAQVLDARSKFAKAAIVSRAEKGDSATVRLELENGAWDGALTAEDTKAMKKEVDIIEKNIEARLKKKEAELTEELQGEWLKMLENNTLNSTMVNNATLPIAEGVSVDLDSKVKKEWLRMLNLSEKQKENSDPQAYTDMLNRVYTTNGNIEDADILAEIGNGLSIKDAEHFLVVKRKLANKEQDVRKLTSYKNAVRQIRSLEKDRFFNKENKSENELEANRHIIAIEREMQTNPNFDIDDYMQGLVNTKNDSGEFISSLFGNIFGEGVQDPSEYRGEMIGGPISAVEKEFATKLLEDSDYPVTDANIQHIISKRRANGE